LPSGPVDDGWAKELSADFETAYERRFGDGTGFSGAGVTLTSLRIVVESSGSAQPITTVITDDGEDGWRPVGTRPVFWRELDSWVDTPILTEHDLKVEEPMDGPAVVEYPHTTVVTRPGQRLWTEASGTLVLELERRPQ
jgi:N-methylhydantoinase A